MEWKRTETDHTAQAGRGWLARLQFGRPPVRRRVRQLARLAGLVMVAALCVRLLLTGDPSAPVPPGPRPGPVASTGAGAARPPWSAAAMLDHLAYSVPSSGNVAVARVALTDRLTEAEATATSRQALAAWASDLPQRAGAAWRLSSMSVDLAQGGEAGLSAQMTWVHDSPTHDTQPRPATGVPSAASVTAFQAGIERVARWSVVTTLEVAPGSRRGGTAATAAGSEARVTARLSWQQLRRVLADIEVWADVAHVEATADVGHQFSDVIEMTAALRARHDTGAERPGRAAGGRQATRHGGAAGSGPEDPRSLFGQSWVAVTPGPPSSRGHQDGAEAPATGDLPAGAAIEWEVHGIVRDAAGWRAAMRHRRGDIHVVGVGHRLEGAGVVASVSWEGVRLVAPSPGPPEDTGADPTSGSSARAAHLTPGARP